MKQTYTIIFCFVFCLSYGQKLEGYYKNDLGEYIFLQNKNKTKFSFFSSDCLGHESMVGMGTYEIKGNNLIIATLQYTLQLESTFKLVTQRKLITETKVKVHVLDLAKKTPIQFAWVRCQINRKNDIGSNTDTNGVAQLVIPSLPFENYIKVGLIGYCPARIPIDYFTDSEYFVLLKEDPINVIENQKLKYLFNLKGDTLIIIDKGKETKVHKKTIHKLIKQ